ncbi:MAG TPA: CidA/LrgA family protein [Candidatus Angelobacter sp.]|nr:CidA/LrgA family protein [Candidatus Angelobacter sp.]
MFGFVFFVGMFLVGDYLSMRFSLLIPGSIIGLGLTVCFLLLRRKVDGPVKQASETFTRYLPLMLVPIGVAGVAGLIESPPQGAWKFILVLVLALLLGAIGAAKLMEAALRLYKASSSGARAVPEQARSQKGEA